MSPNLGAITATSRSRAAPDSVLARRAGAEVPARHQDGGARVAGGFKTNDGSSVRRRTARRRIAGDPLEEHGRDDLVGVHVAAPERQCAPGVGDEWFDGTSSLTGRPCADSIGDGGGGAATAGAPGLGPPALALAAFVVPVEVEAERSPGFQRRPVS